MMITFYPRDIGMWQEDFCFTNPITLTPKEKTNYKTFYDRAELIGFLKEHGVRLDDPIHPLEIIGPNDHPHYGPNTYIVKQWTVVGWLTDTYI